MNVTLMVQLAPAAKFGPQPFVLAKSLLSVPVIAMLLISIDEAVPFFKVSARAALEVSTA